MKRRSDLVEQKRSGTLSWINILRWSFLFGESSPDSWLLFACDSFYCTLFKVYVGICPVISVIEFLESFSATGGFLLLSCVILILHFEVLKTSSIMTKT